ncbi:MAG: DUF4259 domain-containing protein [Gemmatimonadaceae bacterium]|nr:DUF4259 domain-containing protein [Gemmatimonadaceae bacterium]NUS96626.1 DUF4259 domain-containing protein [Gemmatimonadaceae bacterium]
MGIWGMDGPANDDALGWLADLDPAQGLHPVQRALRSVADAADPHVEPTRAQIALAAAELVAAVNGRPSPSLPRAARDWVAAVGALPAPRRDADLDTLVLATRALDMVVTSSQLADLRSADGTAESWRRALDDLRMRLAAAGGMPRNPLNS